MNANKEKVCKTCKKEKPLSEFYGLRYWRRPELGKILYRQSCKKCWNKSSSSYTRAYAKKCPEKRKAKNIAHQAVYAGRIKKHPCVVCGEKKVHGHHPDYSKPIDLVWLCQQHHEDVHHNRIKIT